MLDKTTYADLVTVIEADNLNDMQDAIISLEGSRSADEIIIQNLNAAVLENTDSIGDLSELTTTAKTDLVSAINEAASSGGGLTEDVKVALLDCFEKVAWSVENGQDYVDALEEALYPPANLVSISAVYTQSGTVYDTDSLDSLRDDLVVTATYDDTSTAVITDYILSGTLEVGTSTITVTYQGKTTTFTVTVVTHKYSYSLSDFTVFHGTVSASTNAPTYFYNSNANTASNTRRSFMLASGEQAFSITSDDSTYTEGTLYPIPVPPDATGYTISITPATQYLGIFHMNLSDGVYSRASDNSGWQLGSFSKSFEAGSIEYVAFNSKYNSAGSSYPSEPTGVSVTFTK